MPLTFADTVILMLYWWGLHYLLLNKNLDDELIGDGPITKFVLKFIGTIVCSILSFAFCILFGDLITWVGK